MSEAKQSTSLKLDGERSGWLLKWSNNTKGYRRRWFVLSNGGFSCYRSPEDCMHGCHATIALHSASVRTIGPCVFVVSSEDGKILYLKSANDLDRKYWVKTLNCAKKKILRAMESEEEDAESKVEGVPQMGVDVVIQELTNNLESLQKCYALATKHDGDVQSALSQVESSDQMSIVNCAKLLSERITVFCNTTNIMVTACNKHLKLAEGQNRIWAKNIQRNSEQIELLDKYVQRKPSVEKLQ